MAAIFRGCLITPYQIQTTRALAQDWTWPSLALAITSPWGGVRDKFFLYLEFAKDAIA
jgi:hypothetical protein